MWLSSSSERLGRFKRLVFFVCVYLELWFARFVLWTVPFKVLKRWLGRKGVEGPLEASEGATELAWRVGLAIDKMSAFTPFAATCMVRALAAKNILARRNVSNTLYLGVHKLNSGFGAHAWLRVGREIVTGGPGSEDNAVVGVYTSNHP